MSHVAGGQIDCESTYACGLQRVFLKEIIDFLAIWALPVLENEVAGGTETSSTLPVIHARTLDSSGHIVLGSHFPILVLLGEAVRASAPAQKFEACNQTSTRSNG